MGRLATPNDKHNERDEGFEHVPSQTEQSQKDVVLRGQKKNKMKLRAHIYMRVMNSHVDL